MSKKIIKEQNKILVTGGGGMVGTDLKDIIPNAIFIHSKEYDLRRRDDTLEIFYKFKPLYCIHLAARVGGIKSNMTKNGTFFLDNIRMNTNVLEAAKEYSKSYNIVDKFKLLSILSTCIYPEKIEYPMKEEDIHNGTPHATNYGYAYAKRSLDIMSRAYREQYGSNFMTCVFNNLIGKNDNFDLNDSHVIPALIRKFYEAKNNKKDYVILWGDGTNLREFSYSKDMAKVLLFLLDKYEDQYPINVGNTQEYSIKEVAECISELIGFEGKIVWDSKEPSGIFKKPSSNQKFLDLGWKEEWYTDTKIALKEIVEYFTNNYPNLRGIK